jgi:pimeloyl-ACP methyl ester carboxylesterase/DNA-binding winged helix-turn-helix (wHTH) protein
MHVGDGDTSRTLVRYTFDHYEIDRERLELRRKGEHVPAEPQVFDLLVYLIEHRGRVVTKDELFDEVWRGRVVSLSTLTSRINAARSAIGDDGVKQRLIKTLPRRGYRFVGDVTASGRNAATVLTAEGLQQSIRFCTSCDGVRIAYATAGDGPPIVKVGNWFTHLEYDWQSPIRSHLLHWLAAGRKLIGYDARGNGLSDWDVEDISLEAFVRDLEAVVEVNRLDRFVLFGASQGCAVSILYAARHPEKVSKLVLFGGFARGRQVRGTTDEANQAEAMLTLMRTGWGQENAAFRQLFTSLIIPGGTVEQMSWLNDLQRKTTSPQNAARIRNVSDTLDVRMKLAQVTAPTLVLHCRDDAVQPFEEGRLLAAGMPNARFVGIPGQNHVILERDPGWPVFMRETDRFLDDVPEGTDQDAPR